MNVRASTTKNHKQATIAIHPDLLSELRDLLAKLPARETRVFADLLPTMDTFRADLKAASIEFVDGQGRRADFHVSAEPREVGIGGSSLGGLAGLYAHFRSPEHFGLVMSMSPSLWVGRGKLFEYVASRPKPWTSRIYLDAGGLEAGGGVVRATEKLAGELRARGWDDGSLRVVVAKRGKHDEKAWRRRAPGALSWLFVPGAATKKRAR